MAESKAQNESTLDTEDLDELLKSTLDDFLEAPLSVSSTPTVAAAATAATPETPPSTEQSASKSSDEAGDGFEQKFKDLFLNDIDDATFSNKMSELLNGYQKPNTSTKDSDRQTVPDESTDVVSEAVQSLVENIEEIKETMGAEQFNAGGFDFSDMKNEDCFSFMEQMFQMLMSKEVLYPSLTAVKNQYPAWLEENKDKVTGEEYNRYSQQYSVIKKICTILENENGSDPQNVKQKRFTELVALLQEMTELGQPPKDFSDSLPSTTMNSDLFNALQADIEPNNCNPMWYICV